MPASRSRSPRLTRREVEVGGLTVQGHTTREVGAFLFISPETAKSHLRAVFRKCGVRNRVQLAAWWLGHPSEVGQHAPTGPASASGGPLPSVPAWAVRRTVNGRVAALLGLAATVLALFIFLATDTPRSDTQTIVVATTCQVVSAEAVEDIPSGCQWAPVTAITTHQAE